MWRISKAGDSGRTVFWLPYLPLLAALVGPLARVHAFNVGTSGGFYIDGDADSQFGATLNFQPGERTMRLLVSAPNTVSRGALGEMQLCTYERSTGFNCSPYRHNTTITYTRDSSRSEHFGSSVAMNDRGDVVVCSPQWMDTAAANAYYYFMPGRCSAEFQGASVEEFKPYFNVKVNWLRYVQTVTSMNGQPLVIYNEATAVYGFSVDVSNANFFIAGAPGVLEGEGAVVLTDVQTKLNYKLKVPARDNLRTTAYGYLGYSVKLGSFCAANEICFAASAPNLNRVGMVKVFRQVQNADFSKSLEIIQLISGHQAWSYYGYSMAACDVNGDGLDELLVGAPYFTDKSDLLQGMDQGRVYTYSRASDQQKSLKHHVTLHGSQASFARFGSAIRCIGDINLDGFTDVAVGAPGQDDGAGAIYIYLGSATGLSNPASQTILASMLSSPTKGLGYAISGSYKLPDSMYPVFAASSITDAFVVVFNTRKIIEAKVELTATPVQVDIQAKCSDPEVPGACFEVKLCITGTVRGGGDWDNMFKARLDIDTKIEATKWKRALFRLDGGTMQASVPEIILSTNEQCKNYTAMIMNTQVNQDRFSPVFVVANFDLATISTDDSAPVLDALAPKTATTAVTFKNDCGDNNMCEIDLSITGKLGWFGSQANATSIVVNETTELNVELTVTNSQETNYWTVVEITVNSALPYSRPTPSSDPSVTCQPVTSTEEASDSLLESKVICNYYSPLRSGSVISLGVAFDTELMALDKSQLKVKAKAMHKNEAVSQEMNDQDNSVELITDVHIIADVNVNGISTPSEVTIQKAKRISLSTKADINDGYTVPDRELKLLTVNHRFLVLNEGPSFLPPTKLLVNVPVILQDGSLLVHREDVKLTTAQDVESRCRPLKNFDNLGPVVATTRAPRETTLDPGEAVIDIGETDAPTTTTETVTMPPSTTVDRGGLPRTPVNRRRRRRRRAANSRVKRSTDEDIEDAKLLENIYIQSCETDPQYCQVFECLLMEGLAPDSHVEVNVSLGLDSDNIPVPRNFDTFYYAVRAEVVQPGHRLFLPWDEPSASQSVTKFHLVESGGKINIWIIIGSVILALVIIVVIVLICWKTGFFKRDKHRQVAQWKRESQRRSRLSSAASGSKGPGKGEADG